MNARWLSLALLAALGCAQGEAIPAGALDMAPNVGGLEQPIQGCERVFSPAPELVDATQAAAVRWSAATGCDVHVGEGGIRIIGHAGILDALIGYTSHDGMHALGSTQYDPPLTYIDSAQSAEEVAHTVAHEMGHELTGRPGHAVDGLMRENASLGSQITTATLELVCSELPCAWMQPEE